MTEGLFNFLNILPLPIWVSMILFPRTRFTQRMVMSYWPYMVLGAVYLLFLLVSIFTAGGGFNINFDALRAGLSGEWAFLAAWAHFITFDLFVGVWIFRDAKYWGINPTVFLILTLFAGPVGLGAYLVMRERTDKTGGARVVN